MSGPHILSIRAKGIVTYALGIAAFFFGFIFSVVFLIVGLANYAILSIALGYGALTYGVYFRFIGFKRRFLEEARKSGVSPHGSLARPDVIVSPIFFLYGENLLRDDYGKFAALMIMLIVTGALALFYWLLLVILD